MILQKLRLTDFRNFGGQVFDFSKSITIIVGPNASGKTNILEAIHLIATGKSFKAKVEEEMINYNEEIARVKARVNGDGVRDLEVMLTRGIIERGGVSEKVARKKLMVDGISKRLVDFAGNLKVVLFRPADLELITQSPSIRRRFLDAVLSQVDYEYRRSLLSYEKGLRRRNKLLIMIREDLPASGGRVNRTQLFFWNKLLIKNGDYISRKRREFIDFINSSDKFEKSDYAIDYDASVISETRLEQYAREEVGAGTTLVGPHRDDMIYKLKDRDLQKYGSRGEQRMAVLWTKLSELSFIEKNSENKPLLLLDDIFSELDHEHRKVVVGIAKNQQTIMTTADPHFVEEFEGVEKIELV